MPPPKTVFPPPRGLESQMTPRPEFIRSDYRGSGKLEGRSALITGGDSGIGRAVAVHFAREGADVSILYFDEHEDARETQRLVEQEGRRCLIMDGDVGDEDFCRRAAERTVRELGHLDVLVNNAAESYAEEGIDHVNSRLLESAFRTNIFGYFFMTKAALPYLKAGGSIINTTSVNAYRGNPKLLSYSATKGAIVSFTRSLAKDLLGKGIRVNGVAPGPIWTPLIPAGSPGGKAEPFGREAPMGRAGQPSEVAPSFVFLASSDSSYMTGQVLHPNGGDIVNG